MIDAQQIQAEARRWVGVPYVHQGRTRFGVDCIGLIICVRCAIEEWASGKAETRNYARVPKDALLLQRFEQHCTRIERPEAGCVILIKWPAAKTPAHAGFWCDGNIVHAYQRADRVIETGYRAHWLRDTHSLWRLPGVRP